MLRVLLRKFFTDKDIEREVRRECSLEAMPMAGDTIALPDDLPEVVEAVQHLAYPVPSEKVGMFLAARLNCGEAPISKLPHYLAHGWAEVWDEVMGEAP
jgi:hypothetical protein